MIARNVIGKRIVHIHQDRFFDDTIKEFRIALLTMTLEDGTRIIFHGHETESFHYVSTTLVPPERKKQT